MDTDKKTIILYDLDANIYHEISGSPEALQFVTRVFENNNYITKEFFELAKKFDETLDFAEKALKRKNANR